jgi:hypothetical protein
MNFNASEFKPMPVPGQAPAQPMPATGAFNSFTPNNSLGGAQYSYGGPGAMATNTVSTSQMSFNDSAAFSKQASFNPQQPATSYNTYPSHQGQFNQMNNTQFQPQPM